MSGQLDIFRNAIEKADYSQMYPVHLSSDVPPVEASSGQEQYYVRSA